MTAVDATTGFARACRTAGLPVGVADTADFVRALDLVGSDDIGGLYWTGRALFTSSPADASAYDRVFASYWQGAPDDDARPTTFSAADESGARDDDAEPGDLAAEVGRARYSPLEALRRRDFAACTETELAEAHRLIAGLRPRLATRPSRRHRPARRPDRALDLRTTVRRATATGGEVFELRGRGRREQTRPVVLVCDVSGSMDRYLRSFLRFGQVAAAADRAVEVFTLGTRLTRVTRELRRGDPDRALAAVADRVEDWSGGTRLGEGLAEFNQQWGARGLARGATVVVFSDGWDRGDPALLDREMARLARLAARVVWVNPLVSTDGYEPLAQGMATALPYVDDLVDGSTVRSLEALAEVLTS